MMEMRQDIIRQGSIFMKHMQFWSYQNITDYIQGTLNLNFKMMKKDKLHSIYNKLGQAGPWDNSVI